MNPSLTKPKAIPAALLELKMASGREDGTSVCLRDVSQVLCVLPTQRTDRIATGMAHGKPKRKKNFFEGRGKLFLAFFSYFSLLFVCFWGT